MIKNVLVNGCSFTYGHGDTEFADTGELMPPRDFVWPYKLEKLFTTQMVKTINVSKGGASNNRIVRTTLEGVEKLNQMQLLYNGHLLLEVNGMMKCGKHIMD